MKPTHTQKPRYLWKRDDSGGDDDNGGSGQTLENEPETYHDILQRFSVQPKRRRSLLTLCSNSLVVGQEFILTSLFLARHRAILWEEEVGMLQTLHEPPSIMRNEIQRRHEILMRNLQISQLVAIVAIVIIALFANLSSASQIQPRRTKVQQRTSDAILLAMILRLLAAVLRTLTASYSSDTVGTLAVTGMVVHWLTCDYAYANGTGPHRHHHRHHMTRTRSSTNTLQLLKSSSKRRPTFQGGTVSLNAAFVSATLLASRLSSNATVYIFVSTAVILFAFYPAARHAISAHSYHSAVHLMVTSLLGLSTWLLLENVMERVAFVGILCTICLVAPLWKFWLQRFKRKISGLWDVAPASEMMLDYEGDDDDSGIDE